MPTRCAPSVGRLPSPCANPSLHCSCPLCVITGGREVVINRLAGEAVLQGANVYAPGLLASSTGLAEGDLVAVTVAVEPSTG